MYLKPIRTIPPALDLIETKDARRHCKIDDDAHDTTLGEIVGSVTDYLSAPDGVLRVVLMKQIWRQPLAGFPPGAIQIFAEPLIAVQKIEYLPPDSSTWTEIPAEDWEAYTVTAGAFVQMVDGKSWPDTSNRVECVRVTCELGHTRPDLPRGILAAARLLTAHYFENAEATIVGVSVAELPMGVKALLNPWFRIPV